MFLCITKTYTHMYYYCGMENLTHHEFQLLTGLIGCIAFFAFTGIAYFINELTSKNK